MNLNESEGTAKGRTKPRERWLAALVKLPPLSWWLRDPVERESFKLTTAYLVRDREIKMRLYPGVAPLLIMPLVMLFSGGTGKGGAEAAIMMQGFATCFLDMLSMQAMLFLGCSEHWRSVCPHCCFCARSPSSPACSASGCRSPNRLKMSKTPQPVAS
jgi:hypothetical protein